MTSGTRSIAASWWRYGITANTIVPAMWTPLYDEHRAQFTAEELVAHDAAMAQMIAIAGRLGTPTRDLVHPIIFMPGAGSRYMTGQNHLVNSRMNRVRQKVATRASEMYEQKDAESGRNQ